MGVDLPDFRERQVENRDKTGKCLTFQGFDREFLLFVLNGKNAPHFTILTPNVLFDSGIEPEN